MPTSDGNDNGEISFREKGLFCVLFLNKHKVNKEIFVRDVKSVSKLLVI
jgi:hypothetical protein